MTIQEAIKSGKPFKRIKWDDSIWLCLGMLRRKITVIDRDKDDYIPFVEDILADDWIVREE